MVPRALTFASTASPPLGTSTIATLAAGSISAARTEAVRMMAPQKSREMKPVFPSYACVTCMANTCQIRGRDMVGLSDRETVRAPGSG